MMETKANTASGTNFWPNWPPAAAPSRPSSKRVKTPTVLQMEAVECGAASLAIILRYYGSFIPLEEMRVSCGVSRDGSKASNLLTAARSYGLSAKGFRKEPEQLREMKFPMIIHWNFNHFLVLEGFKKNKVYLNDPANGPRVVDYEEFDNSYTGVVLTFEPAPGYVPTGGKPNLLKSLGRRVRGTETALSLIILTGLALVIPGLVVPVFTRVFVDNVLLAGMDYWLKPLLIGMGLTALLRALLTWLQRYYLLRLETKIALKSSSEFFWHVLRLPVEFFSQRHLGDISSRVMINDRVAQLLSGDLAVAALNSAMIVFYFALMIQYSIPLTLIAVLTALLNFAFLRMISKLRVDQNRRLLQEQGKLQGVSMGGLQLIETIKSSGGETDFFAKWSGYQSNLMNSLQKSGVLNQALSSVPALLTAVSTALVLCLGGLQVIDGDLTIGTLVAFQSLMASFIGPVNQLLQLGGALQEAEGSMSRLDDVLNYKLDSRDAEHIDEDKNGKRVAGLAGERAFELAKLSGLVELRGISFGYSRLEEPLVKEFSLTLKPGARVALVGGSGSGKSTVAKLVAGIYEPWSGEIAFDGKKREDWPRELISHSVAMVDQDISMFEGTVRNNLTLWDSTAEETEVIRAAKDSCIHEDITARSGSYDHMLDESGSNFSGGQRQRLEIARALVNDPSVLILDEATSALDPRTEKIVDDHLRRRGCTCLIVAHRLSTIRDADEIIVMSKGKAVERGTHEELMRLNGYYVRLMKDS